MDSTARVRQEISGIVALISTPLYRHQSIMRVLAIKLVIVHTAAPESARKNPPVMLEKSLGPTVMKENFRGSRFSLRTERMRPHKPVIGDGAVFISDGLR